MELLPESQTRLTNLHRTLETLPDKTTAAAFDPTFERQTQAVQQRGLTGIPIGFDGLTGGWQPGDLVLLAACPAMDKTAVLLHFARTAALDHGHHTAIFSLEMPPMQFMQRMVASGVPGYSNFDLGLLIAAGGQTYSKNKCYIICDCPLAKYHFHMAQKVRFSKPNCYFFLDCLSEPCFWD